MYPGSNAYSSVSGAIPYSMTISAAAVGFGNKKNRRLLEQQEKELKKLISMTETREHRPQTGKGVGKGKGKGKGKNKSRPYAKKAPNK